MGARKARAARTERDSILGVGGCQLQMRAVVVLTMELSSELECQDIISQQRSPALIRQLVHSKDGTSSKTLH